eukprot:7711462-Prorocentrum_lima.AAC.1
MTSSLVGSEMCIRDSQRPGCPGDTPRTQTVSLWGSRSCNFIPDSITPVSYTHLTLPTICSV